MSEKQFKAQVNYGWGLSFNMTGKAPAVAKRIFDTYADALAYANDVNDSAIEGLKLSVVADSDSTKNGVYFVQQIATPAIEADEENGIEAVEAKNAILVRFKFDDESSDTTAILEAAKEYTDSEIKELTEGIVKSNADAISILNGDDKTQGSVAKALTDAKAYIDSKVVNLDATVGSKEVTDGKHVAVEVVEVDGKLTTVTVTESDIASASVLAEVKKNVDNFFKDASFSENARDTLSELQEYINTDAQGALAMEQAIATNKAGIEAEVAMAREEESKLDQAITSEVNRAQDAELTLARDINTAFSQLNTIESTVATNKEVIENSLNSLDESITIKSGSGTNSSLQINSPGSKASGTNSLAVGMDAVASGDYSVAMGRGCSATGRGSIALGGVIISVKLTGDKDVLKYHSNIDPIIAEYLSGFNLVKTSNLTTPVATITASEVIDNVVYITVDKTLSNSSALSNTVFGLIGCKSSQSGSIALGSSLLSSGLCSVAEGYFTVASGESSHTEGSLSIAKGKQSHAEGGFNIAEGIRSHAEGYYTVAKAASSHTEGARSLASGDASHAEGHGTVASGDYSHAEGSSIYNIYLTGNNSTYQINYGGNIQNTFHFIKRCQGASIIEYTNFTKIAVINSIDIAEDGYTVTVVTDVDLGELSNYKCGVAVNIASGQSSHTENAAQSSGKDSHAGGWSLATNTCSLSHGYDCVADGETSTSFGTNTYSQNNSEFALGRSNHSHTGETLAEQTLFSVGCGDFEQIDMSKRIEQQLPLPTPEDGTNALEIMQNGDIWLGGYEEGVKLFEGETKELNTYTKEELNVELDSKIESEPVNTSITNIEESLVSSALRKTPQTLTESEKEQARTNIEAQKELTLTVKDNGNIVISNIQGQTKEFMPATPSGDPMHYAYIAAGAEWNDTENVIKKTPIWKTEEFWQKEEDGTYTYWEEDVTVDHLPKHWYLNGIGDIANNEMKEIYNNGRLYVGNDISNLYTTTARTALPSRKGGGEGTPFDLYYLCGNSSYIETLLLTNNKLAYASSIHCMFANTRRIVRIFPAISINTTAAANISGSFKNAKTLKECELQKIVLSVSYADCPLIYKRSILGVINTCNPKSAITITLHPDAYARIVNQPDIIAALEAKNAALDGTGGSISLVSA